MPELIFIHVPKTGGLSFLHTLNEVYGQKNVKQIWDVLPWHDSILHDYSSVFYVNQSYFRKVVHAALKSAPNCKVWHGHMPAWVLEGLFPEAKRIAWVRHPVDQVLSRVFHFRKMEIEYAPWSGSPEILAESWFFRNCQTFYLGLSLQQFAFIGVVEEYKQDFETCCEIMGWSDVELVHHHRTEYEEDRRREIVEDPSSCARLAEINYLDFMLYNQVLEKRGTWN